MEANPYPTAKEARYQCAVCHRPALVAEGRISRTCEHHDAGVTADMTAVTFGVGGMQE